MSVLHIYFSPCSGVPAIIKRVFREHGTGIEHRLLKLDKDNIDYAHVKYELSFLKERDIIHWHDRVDNSVVNATSKLRHMVQYHTEPSSKDINYIEPPGNVSKFVIPHYHQSLNFFKHCRIIRNFIHPDIARVQAQDIHWRPHKDRVRIAMSVSNIKPINLWQDKGYTQMQYAINVVKKYCTDNKIKLNITYINKETFTNSVDIRLQNDILIDECVTPSYHMTSLENLGLGRPSFCWVDDTVLDNLYKCTGTSIDPFENHHVCWLPERLIEFIKNGPEHWKIIGKKNRDWFNRWWNNKDILREYIKIYNTIK